MIDNSKCIHTKDWSKIIRTDIETSDDVNKLVKYICPNELRRFYLGNNEGIWDIKRLKYERKDYFLDVLSFITRYLPERPVRYGPDVEGYNGNYIIPWVFKYFGSKQMPMRVFKRF